MQYRNHLSKNVAPGPISQLILSGKLSHLSKISRPLAAAILGSCLAIMPAIAARAGSANDAPFLVAQAMSASDLYMVYVDGDSPQVLQTVQQVEPTAFRRFFEMGGTNQTVIQAGVFQQLSNAQQRVLELQNLVGLDAQIATVAPGTLSAFAAPDPTPSVTAAPATTPAVTAGPAALPPSEPGVDYTFTTIPDSASAGTTGGGVTAPPPITAAAVPPAPEAAGAYTTSVAAPAATAPVPASVYETPTPVYSAPAAETFASPTPPPLTATYYNAGSAPLPKGYYVSVPAGSQADLAVLNEEIIALRTGGWGLYPRKGPLGRHVAVGPFAKRTAAESWSEYYRANGLDARVFRSRR